METTEAGLKGLCIRVIQKVYFIHQMEITVYTVGSHTSTATFISEMNVAVLLWLLTVSTVISIW